MDLPCDLISAQHECAISASLAVHAAVLARQMPSEDVRDMGTATSISTLQFGDLPQTTQLVSEKLLCVSVSVTVFFPFSLTCLFLTSQSVSQ